MKIDLTPLYQSILNDIYRAYIFMRFGSTKPHIHDFRDTDLPGKQQILIVPEPVSAEQLGDYIAQFRAWTIGNGLRELVESYGNFLDAVYQQAVCLKPLPSDEVKSFHQLALRGKIQRLRDTFGIDGGFSKQFESFSAVRNTLAHGVGIVRPRDCLDGQPLLILNWRGIDVYFQDDQGNRYKIGEEPDGTKLREPLDTITVDRQKSWKIGERVDLTPFELSEICYMAKHDALEVLQSLAEFAAQYGVEMIVPEYVLGGEDLAQI
jgi:hypothetical protein